MVSLLFMAILFYKFYYLEKIQNPIMKKILALIRFWGDSTLSIYIGHWIVIDIMMWIFFPQYKLIWWAVPAALTLYSIVKIKIVKEYIANQV